MTSPAGWIARAVRRLRRLVRALRPRFDFIAADLTDTCHLRCTFCGNDFSHGTSRVRMDRGTFSKLVGLLELVDDGGMMLSCRYEPFLHPQFLDMVETVPPELRCRTFFTTSLTLPLADEAIERLARLGLHHINVSVDSFRAETFEAIRRGARFDRFADNLERLCRRFADPDATPLQFITVVVRPNVDEVPGIVGRCLDELGGRRHEVRHVFLAPHLDEAWRRENVVEAARWDWLEGELAGHGGRVVLDRPPAAAPAGAPVALIVFADGRVQLHSRPEPTYRLSDIDDPRDFFRKRLAELRGA